MMHENSEAQTEFVGENVWEKTMPSPSPPTVRHLSTHLRTIQIEIQRKINSQSHHTRNSVLLKNGSSPKMYIKKVKVSL
jgi:hypothetical protein